jgi:tetratricopeptide (TPR) repeat protein
VSEPSDLHRLKEAADAGAQVARRSRGELAAARQSLERIAAEAAAADAALGRGDRHLADSDGLFTAVATGAAPARRRPPAAVVVLAALAAASLAATAAVLLAPAPPPPGAPPMAESLPAPDPPPPPAATRDLNAGLAHMGAGRYAEAVPALRAAADGGADPKLALGSLAECYFYLRLDADALATCDRLNAAVPNAGPAHYVRGLVLLRQGKKEQAYAELRKAARHGERAAATLLPPAGPDARKGGAE